MAEPWDDWIDQGMPHGSCLLWEPQVIWLHVTADTLLALAYYGLPLLLIYLLRRRPDLPFHGMFMLFERPRRGLRHHPRAGGLDPAGADHGSRAR